MNSLIVQNHDGSETITVYGLGQLKVVDSAHPNFAKIRSMVSSGQDPEDVEAFEALFDVVKTIQRAFMRLTDRVTVKGETVLFNHEPIHGVLADQILRYLDEGEDMGPLVNFQEKVADNPSKNSQEALYTWLKNRNFVLKPNGNFLGYKGVKDHTAPTEGPHAGVPASGFEGHAYVDDVEYGQVDENHKLIGGRGEYIPYPIGALIEMPLPECVDDSSVECSRGLHVGTYEFARGYAVGTKVLAVEVNPRDVVSVPSTWGGNQKIRVTRLRVVEEVDGPYQTPVAYDEGEHTDLDEGYFASEEDEQISNDDLLDAAEDLSSLDDDYDLPGSWRDRDYEDYEDEDEEPDEFEAELPAIAPMALPNPPQDWFEEYLSRAKRRRQPVVRYIEHMTLREGHPWRYDGSGDPKGHLSWSVENVQKIDD